MYVIGIVVLMAAEFILKAWKMRYLVKNIDVRQGKLIYRLYYAYRWYIVYLAGLFLLPEYLCHLEGGEYRVLSLAWGLTEDLGLFTLLLDVFVVLALLFFFGYVNTLRKRIGQ